MWSSMSFCLRSSSFRGESWNILSQHFKAGREYLPRRSLSHCSQCCPAIIGHRWTHHHSLRPQIPTLHLRSSMSTSTNEVIIPVSSASINSSSLTDSAAIPKLPIDPGYVPEPPSLVDSQLVEQLTSLGEPTLASLGLCSYWPSGLVQRLLEFMHITGDVPWWASITIFAVSLRIIVLPLQIYVTKIAVQQGNVMPPFMKLVEEHKRAVERNDIQSAILKQRKMQLYEQQYKPSPRKQLLGPMYQMPIFLSCMIGIRGMANLPVETMQTGGALWFLDLTISDPYHALPILTGLTLLANVELGAEGLKTAGLTMKQKWVLRSLLGLVPVVMWSQPAALCLYWFVSNIVAVLTMAVIKTPSIKQRLGIPDPIKHELTEGVIKESFIQGVKRATQNNSIVTARERRELTDATAFKDAGRARKVKTFSYDPTKQNPEKPGEAPQA